MYTPQRRPGMVVEELFEERLVYVSSMRDHTQPPGNDYVYVDWGRVCQPAQRCISGI